MRISKHARNAAALVHPHESGVSIIGEEGNGVRRTAGNTTSIAAPFTPPRTAVGRAVRIGNIRY